jgi:hypothetical protein
LQRFVVPLLDNDDETGVADRRESGDPASPVRRMRPGPDNRHAESRLLELFTIDDELTQSVALLASFYLTSRIEGLSSRQLAHAVDRGLKSGVGALEPGIRSMLEERIQPLL